ncbi:hypothetical protein NX059_003659 [Plenodomus lindquistii]|nr:hypothetical protein NX059_003659 [Plenodomus lindquistii]
MFPPEIIEKILEQGKSTASHSWEYGTLFEAILEYENPKHSIFHHPFPDNTISTLHPENVKALQYVEPHIRLDSDTLCEGNGSSSDPASLGIPALLLSKTHPDYFNAASRQLHTLTHLTPRHPNGALSHRVSEVSLWADFVYMVPPFLAYYGVFTNDLALVQEAVRQCDLYQQLLATENGCWKHIVNAPGTDPKLKPDPGLWSTSNAWVVAGMARVLGTLRYSHFAAQTVGEQALLLRMVKRIVDGVVACDTDSSGLLRNYLDDDEWFGEVAGTALMAAAVLRLGALEGEMFGGDEYMRWAVRKGRAVEKCVDADTGVVAPVVNSLTEGQRNPLEGVNPEAQAFVVLLFAAWRDAVAAGKISTMERVEEGR